MGVCGLDFLVALGVGLGGSFGVPVFQYSSIPVFLLSYCSAARVLLPSLLDLPPPSLGLEQTDGRCCARILGGSGNLLDFGGNLRD